MKILKKIFIVLLFIGSSSNLFAQIQQNEGNWWYFGLGAGLNFNIKNTPRTSNTGSVVSDLPIPITGPMSTNEGCFTLSDTDGNLIMFGDGSTIWNRNHQIMPNATNLGGNSSTAQSGIIMPVPGTSNKFYAFSVSAQETGSLGIRYAIVDISLNGGLGGIATENGVLQKNILLQGPTNAENITAVMNPDGSGFWIINWSPISETINRFRVYKATSSGITLHSSKDVVSYGSTYIASQLKFNTEGTRFVSANPMFLLYYGDFNPQTGIITHLAFLNLSNFSGSPFGLEFSPNGQYVYFTQLGGYSLKQVPWSSIRSGTLNGTYNYTNDNPDNIQLAPDGRIYGISTSTRDLYVILNPNLQGAASNVQRINNYLLNSAFLGLPNFSAGYLAILPEPEPLICKGNSYNFSVEFPLPTTQALTPTQLVWNWGDGSSSQSQPYVANQTKYIMGNNYQTIGEKNIQVQIFRNQTLLRTITLKREITDCDLQVNRMIRVNVDNESTQKTKNP